MIRVKLAVNGVNLPTGKTWADIWKEWILGAIQQNPTFYQSKMMQFEMHSIFQSLDSTDAETLGVLLSDVQIFLLLHMFETAKFPALSIKCFCGMVEALERAK